MNGNLLRKKSNNIRGYFAKLLFLLSPIIVSYLYLLLLPQYSDKTLEVFLQVKHYQQYANPENQRKIQHIKSLTNEYIDEIYAQLNSIGYTPKFRPDVFVVPRNQIFDNDPMAIAACTFESGNITIYVNDNYESSFFTKKNYFGKMVVLHELGHCLFKLKHTQNEIDIMAERIGDSSFDAKMVDPERYLQNLNYYGYSENILNNAKISNEMLYKMILASENEDRKLSIMDIKAHAFLNLFDYYPVIGKINNLIAKKMEESAIGVRK